MARNKPNEACGDPMAATTMLFKVHTYSPAASSLQEALTSGWRLDFDEAGQPSVQGKLLKDTCVG